MSKLSTLLEKNEVHKVWNYILPEQNKSDSYNPIQSIPLLTTKNQFRNSIKKRKAKKA
jgi:hypothetical protein